MTKFFNSDFHLTVIEYSQYYPLYLNREIINLLSCYEYDTNNKNFNIAQYLL